MPPKSSTKKVQATWFYCDICCANITSKGKESHEQDCPIPSDDTQLIKVNHEVEFVRDGKLYTRSMHQRNFEVESLKDLPGKYMNSLLFLSEGVIRLAKFHYGQHVVVTSLENETETPVVRMLWPITEQFLTSVFASEQDFQHNWSKQRGTLLSISALNSDQLSIASRVNLRLLDETATDLEPSQLQNAKVLLKQDMINLIYGEGSKLHLNFFNKLLDFTVDSWSDYAVDHPVEVNVEKAFSQLTLEKTRRYFQVTNTTTVEILDCECNEEVVAVQEHQITKANIGGLDKQLQLVEECIDYAFGFKSLPSGVKVSRGLLLYGATGCGKTLVCEAMCSLATSKAQKVANKSRLQVIKVSSGEIYSKFLGETEKNLLVHFERAYAHYPQPTLILLEDVHNLCPKHETSEVVKRVSLAFLSMLDQMSSRREAERVFLLATTSQIDALHPSIRRAGRLDCEVEIGAPSPPGRQSILNCLLQKVNHKLTNEEVEHIASITHGYVGADLANLVYTAMLAALKHGSRPLEIGDLNDALTHVKPSAMREVLIENPNVQWSDIGGQDALRLALQQAIEWPLLHAEKFQRLGIKPPRGVLMFGPPGCSKTMIAKALATESKLNFLSIKGPELFSMWVGESERAVREVFRKARQVAPAIVFFDEIDAIGGERAEGSGSSGGGGGGSGASVKERVLTQLLTEMDGVESLQNVTIVAATNRPDMIDKALLRPGRIDRIVYVGLPDAAARREILNIKLRPMPLADDVDKEMLIERTSGYSGAEIQAVCHEAALHALQHSFEAEHVEWMHFEYALQAVQPRTSPELLKLYDDYAKRRA